MIRFRRDEQRVVGQELARGRRHDLCDMHHAFVRGALTWTIERMIRISRKAVNTDVVAIAAKLDLPPSPDDLGMRAPSGRATRQAWRLFRWFSCSKACLAVQIGLIVPLRSAAWALELQHG
jgi:hypothetical protein